MVWLGADCDTPHYLRSRYCDKGSPLIFLGKGQLIAATRISFWHCANMGRVTGIGAHPWSSSQIKVKFFSCLLMAGEAIQAEAVVDILETALIYFAAVLARIDRKKIPSRES
jgi:hypothetical protein